MPNPFDAGPLIGLHPSVRALIPGRSACWFTPIACHPCDYAECLIGYVCLQEISLQMAPEAVEQVIRY